MQLMVATIQRAVGVLKILTHFTRSIIKIVIFQRSRIGLTLGILVAGLQIGGRQVNFPYRAIFLEVALALDKQCLRRINAKRSIGV